MITKNFKARIATLLQMMPVQQAKGLVPVYDTSGTTRYMSITSSSGSYNFPVSSSQSVVFNANAGIHVGRGNTPATENDYTLEDQITSGLTASTPTITQETDSSGNPYVEFLFTLSNTTANDIEVAEIGYFQLFRLSDTQGGNITTTNRVLLLDRTILSPSVIVPANDSVAIKYTLKTIMPT